jgi:hypothetical protein
MAERLPGGVRFGSTLAPFEDLAPRSSDSCRQYQHLRSRGNLHDLANGIEPFSSGMLMSMTTTSGFSPHFLHRFPPVVASPTISQSFGSRGCSSALDDPVIVHQENAAVIVADRVTTDS